MIVLLHMPKIVCIDGNIGAGKSTVLHKLKELGFRVFTEGVDRWGDILAKFYETSKRWSFCLQVAILSDMYSQYTNIKSLEDDVVFIERCPESALIFANLSHVNDNMHHLEFNTYLRLHSQLKWTPDITILLESPSDVCMKRVLERARVGESFSKEYYLSLQEQYDKYKQHILTIDTNRDLMCIIDDILKVL